MPAADRGIARTGLPAVLRSAGRLLGRDEGFAVRAIAGAESGHSFTQRRPIRASAEQFGADFQIFNIGDSCNRAKGFDRLPGG